ncbi:MAG: Peptidase S74 domain-containing protein [Pseudolactococcus raffinolactis]|uniref:hypothetical protein n=1 Tax=Pseudolactococcus raffinolactis TaxID=1366 RepID=UPI003A5BA59F
MSYEKQAWSKYDALKSEEENIENGAVVTDSRMNHMEDGIEVNSNAVENHIANKLNPHSVTKNQVGLGNVQNFGLATENEAKQGDSNAKYMTPSLTQAVLSANINSTAYANSADGTDGFTVAYPDLNLLDGTKNFSGTWNFSGGWTNDGTYKGLTVKKKTIQWNGISKSFIAQEDGVYTFSAYVKSSGENANITRFCILNTFGVDLLRKGLGNNFDWTRDSLNINLKAGDEVLVRYEISGSGTDSILWVAGYKWEHGSVATPWMPSSSEVTATDWPKFVGFSNTVKTDKTASDYTWFPDLTNKVEDHVNNKSNPHAVTASQTGAYTKGEVESKLLLKAVDSEVVHKENNENISGSKTFTGQTKVGNLEVTGNIKLTGMIGEWTNIPLVAGYTAGDGQTPQVRKVRTAEGLIRIDYRGAIGATSGNLPIAQVTVGTIPTDFLPLGTVLMQGSDNTGRGGRVACLTSGEMKILAPNTSAYVYLNSTFYYQ